MYSKCYMGSNFDGIRGINLVNFPDSGTDVKYIQALLGHNDIKTTLRYLHETNRDLGKIESPLDKIARRMEMTDAV